MNSRQRVLATLKGEPVDRIAISGWKHFPQIDRDVEAFVQKTIEFTDRNEFDIVKIMSQSQFFVEAFGAKIAFPPQPGQIAGKVERFVIESAEELASLKPLTLDNPVLQREISIARKLVEHYQGEKVIVSTLFTPLTWLKKFTPGDPASAHLYDTTQQSLLPDFFENHRDALHNALQAINETSKIFVDALLEAGVDGIFLAEQFGSLDHISGQDYDEFSAPYTQALVDYVQGRTLFNILHIHGSRNLLVEKFLGYELESINWEDGIPDTPDHQRVSFGALRSLTDRVLIGGIDPAKDFSQQKSREEHRELVRSRLAGILRETGGQKVILAPGCGFSIDFDEEHLTVIKEVAEEYGHLENRTQTVAALHAAVR